ncbi:MAG: 3-deoxy-manno-octulosonate cytidylyltransferase [Polyangiaceae bacterium]|nr:3-deoxy-manno-octulosonate cytidylyltransferase [Polyangiaceae bacterium]
MTSPRFRVVIPARLESTRLPRKPLLDVAGKPLVLRVLERAAQSGAEELLVATDSSEIADVVQRAGGRAVMTSSAHASGTDRIAEVARKLAFAPDDIVVNLQGDEPLVPAPLLAAIAGALEARREASIATLATPIRALDELFDPNAVKVVRDDSGLALYFSRAPMPWVRDAFADREATALPPDVPFLRHLGLYAYRVSTLERLAAASESTLERAEKLEQLRALALGMRIHVGVIEEPPPPGVDSAEDLARVRRIFEEASR